MCVFVCVLLLMSAIFTKRCVWQFRARWFDSQAGISILDLFREKKVVDWCPHCVVSTRWRFCVNLYVFLYVFVDVFDFYKKMRIVISSQMVWFSGRDLHSRPVSWKKCCRFFQVVLIPSIYFRVCLFQEPRSSLQGYLSQVLLKLFHQPYVGIRCYLFLGPIFLFWGT